MIKKLLEMAAAKYSFSAIGERLGVGKNAAWSKYRRLTTEEENMNQMDRFAEALSEGASIKEAGEAVDVKETRAREIMKAIRAGLGSQAM